MVIKAKEILDYAKKHDPAADPLLPTKTDVAAINISKDYREYSGYKDTAKGNLKKWAYATEAAYITLSLTAKIILGFGIIFGNFAHS